MRPGVRFSDGQPLTADDVVFSYEFIMNPAIAAPRARAYYSKIARVEKTAEDEVTFIYEEPYFLAFELAAGMDIMPRHFYGRFEPEQFNQSLGLLLGSGPYRLEDPEAWRPGQLIQLVRNERYWGVPPAFDRLVYREITHDIARMQAFRNGDTDQFGATPEQYIDMIRDQNLLARTHQFEYQNPIGGYRYIAWNQRQGEKPTRFADKRVRQALTMLLDRQRLIDEVMLGYAVLSTGPFNPLSRQFNPDIEPWPHDVARAEALLAEAGFVRGRDGVLRGSDGQPFRFRLTYPSGSANYERMVLLVKDSFARAGIVVDPDPLEWAVFTDRLNNRNFDAITLGWTSGIETDIYQMFHSDLIADQGDNFISYRSPELDSLIEQARRTVKEDERMPLWRRAHAVLHEDQPYTFLFFGKTLRFIDKRISNIEPVKLGLNPTVEWFVPRDQQRWTR
jgi:peptide/nickel transport system substrate-binding protein